MTLFAAVFMFTVMMAATVIIIISDNKTKRGDKSFKKISITKGKKLECNDGHSNVYDGVPLYRCKRCGAHAVIVSLTNAKQEITFYARCKECGQGTAISPDLGFVINNWNCSFGIKPKDIMGPPMKL